jgi:uncharacterized Tic20 family protein
MAEPNKTAEESIPDPSPRERRQAALAHGAVLLVFFVPLGNVAGPALAHFIWGRASPFVAFHALAATVFQVFVSLLAWGLFLFASIHGTGLDAHFAALLLPLVLHLPAAVQALRGRRFLFPLLPAWLGS